MTHQVLNDDLRLVYVDLPDWQRGTRQALLGTNITYVDPISKISPSPSQVDFELPREDHLLFGVLSKFRIKGVFQKQAGANADWVNLGAGDAAKVFLAPFWFEHLLKETSCFHDTYKIASGTESRHVTPFLNAYLHHNMDPVAKKLLCPQETHPAYCMPAPDGKWTNDCTNYVNYSKAAFNGAFTFDYTPLFQFPFFQGPNYLIDDDVPRILPCPIMGKIQIRFAFTDSQDHIFRKADAADTNTYRFTFQSFTLVLEEARLNTNFDRQLRNTKHMMAYPGVTRIQLTEHIPDSTTSYKVKFQDIYLPEAIFLFCLDKSVASGTFKFSTDTSDNIFKTHNIDSIVLSFDGKNFGLREPHLGNFAQDQMDSKSLFDKIASPPFGIRQDVTKLTHAIVREGSKATAFPHVYLSLVTGPNRQRLIPTLDDGQCVFKKANLDLDIKFTNSNAPKNSIFAVFAIWTDVNLIYDPKKKLFSSYYLQYMN